MSREVINNGETGLVVRGKLNSNFTELYARQINVNELGADPTGVADSTAVIQGAINSLPFGGEVILPDGVFNYSSLSVGDGVTLRGRGEYATVLRCTSATGKITADTSSAIVGVKFNSSVTRALGHEFITFASNGVSVKDCAFQDYTLAIRVGDLGGTPVVRPIIDNCNFFNPVVGVGSGAIALDNYINAIVKDCTGAGAALPAQQPDFGVRIWNGDTCFLVNNNFTLHGESLLMNVPAGYNSFATQCVNCCWDSAGTISGGTSASSAAIVPAGNVYDTLFANTWFGLSAGASGLFVQGQGAGKVEGLSFVGCEFPDSADAGLIVVGSAVKNWSVTGGWSAGNTNYGIRAALGTSYFSITGHTAGNVAPRGPNGIGIQVDGGSASDYYQITGNNLYGNTLAGIFDGGTGTNVRVTDNAGASGTAVPASVTVGASPFTYTAGHSEEVHYIRGGTVSNVTQAGVSVFTATGCTLHLAPGETYQVTYSSAPTILRKVL